MARALMSAPDLMELVDDGSVTVVDCRWYLAEPLQGRAAYEAGHIPNALYASLDSDLSGRSGPGRHPLPMPRDFSATLGRLGIHRHTRVVAYDDRGGAVASRLWWMLRDQGHESVQVLDGGIQAWQRAGGGLELGASSATPTDPYPTRPWQNVVNQADVAARPQTVVVIDARAEERFEGLEEPVDPVAGHVPGARSHPLTLNLSEDTEFVSPDQLRRLFERSGISPATSTISMCGSGVTACHNILAMDIAGLPHAALYEGSWSDWSTSDRPVASGPA